MTPETKPVREWLEELPEPYRAAAIRNYGPNADPEFADSIADAVDYAFWWDDSPEGSNFWAGVFESLRAGISLPAYPGPAPQRAPGADTTPNSEEAAGESPYDRAAKEAAERWAKRDQQQQARIHQLERLAEKRGKELERMRGEQQWQPIETAPKDGTSFLGTGWDHGETNGTRHHAVVWWDEELEGFMEGQDDWVESACPCLYLTHWMPLPEPPASTEGGGE